MDFNEGPVRTDSGVEIKHTKLCVSVERGTSGGRCEDSRVRYIFEEPRRIYTENSQAGP